MKKSLAIRFGSVALGLAALLCACGGSSSQAAAPAVADEYARAGDTAAMEMENHGALVENHSSYSYSLEGSDMAGDPSAGGGGKAEPTVDNAPDDGRKITMTAWVSIEALEYPETLAALDTAINTHGAYISSSSIYSDAVGYRTADYTVKVPAANYRAFMEALGGTGNLYSRSESSEDLTTQYVDTEARLTSLRAQEERLLELLGEAGDLETLLLIQQQLTEVQYQLEYYLSMIRTMDRQVAYSTVNISVYEVIEYTEPEPETYGTRLGSAFAGGWKGALTFLQSLSIGLVGALPLLLFLAVAAVAVILIVRRRRKNPKPSGINPAGVKPQDFSYNNSKKP